jgi:Na+/H+ antiporter NhaB
MATDLIPKNDGDLAIWLGNFQSQLAALGPDFWLSPIEVTAGSAACTEIFTKIGAAETKKNESQQATQEKNISKKNTISLIRSYARRIKVHPTYDSAMGQLMNIIGEDQAERDKTCALLAFHHLE